MSQYRRFMEKKIQPWLSSHARHGFINGFDGLKLSFYAIEHPSPKASVVVVHGFCEFFGKYHELVYRFYEHGYTVYFLELRGHGKSGRPYIFQDSRIHVAAFDDYVDDLKLFIEKEVKAQGPLFLFAHSLGGAIGALLMEERPDLFACAVLSSPMLKMSFGNIPYCLTGLLSVYMNIAKVAEEFAPGQKSWQNKYEFADSSCLSRERYEYQFDQRKADPDYQTWGGTWGWAACAKIGSEKAVREAYKVRTPVLLCQAGKDTLVLPEGQLAFAERTPKTVLLRFAEGKHELYNMAGEALEEYYRDVFVYFDAHARSLKGPVQ